MIVIEFMANGSLDNFLKVSLPDFAIWLLMIVVSWNYRLLMGIIKDVVAYVLRLFYQLRQVVSYCKKIVLGHSDNSLR